MEELTIADCLIHMSTMLDNMAAIAKVNEDRKLRFRKDESRSDTSEPTNAVLADIAQRIYNSRRARAKHFPDLFFGEPAWDMMLDLFIHAVHRKPVSVTSLGIASGVPATTALRHIEVLTNEGLVERVRAAHDARVSYISLTAEGFRRVAYCMKDQARAAQVTKMQSIVDWSNDNLRRVANVNFSLIEDDREKDAHVRV